MPESFLIRVGMEDTIYHKWMTSEMPLGDVTDDFVNRNVLCFRVRTSYSGNDIFVTDDNECVTCQECLELIHA